MTPKAIQAVALLGLLLSLAPQATGQVRFEDAFPDLPSFDRPVDLQMAPDGERWFVVEQPGVITSFETDDPSARDTVLDLRFAVNTTPSWEEGMLGLAFHPDYEENGYIFIHYTAYPATEGGPHRTFIARFTVSGTPPVADPTSELVLFDIDQPLQWHNGGQLAFHPLEDEANLYIALGDGGGIGDPLDTAQDRSSLLGSILRIDVDTPSDGRNYGVPADNPFVGNDQGWREEIWAYGLRNPWRLSIDPATGDLWVGDVGQDRWEEVTRVTESGANLGWDVKEAAACYSDPDGADPDEPPCDAPGLLDPIWWYPRSEGQSVTGGHVYRGSEIPELAGRYVYGDFMTGRVWALAFEGLGEPVNSEIGRLPTVSTFGVDGGGELYAAAFDGRVYRFVRDPVDAEPGAPEATAALRLAGPNPFRTRTALVVRAAAPGPVRVVAYDVLGREVAVLYDGVMGAEEVRVPFEAEALPAGAYVVRVTGAGAGQALRLTALR